MRFGKISCFFTSSIISVSFDFGSIKDKRAPRYVQYLGKNIIELFIKSNKTPYLFIHRRLRIIEYYSNSVMSKRARLLI